MTDPAAPFTPPIDWTTVDAAAWAREFVEHATADPRLPLDWDAMTVWFARAIEAGIDHGRRDATTPTRFDPDDRDTWPDDAQHVLRADPVRERWHAQMFAVDWKDGRPYWVVEVGTEGLARHANDGDLWLPLPPTPEVQG